MAPFKIAAQMLLWQLRTFQKSLLITSSTSDKWEIIVHPSQVLDNQTHMLISPGPLKWELRYNL